VENKRQKGYNKTAYDRGYLSVFWWRPLLYGKATKL